MGISKKTPDQIRRETVPVKHNGLIYGFLAGIVGVGLWFGGWALFHQKQTLRYPEYVACFVKANTSGLSLFGGRSPRRTGMSADQLRYGLMRYGNCDHRFDAEIIRHGWYPRDANPKMWVRESGAVPALYSDDPLLVFTWPAALSFLTFLIALICGLIVDSRYRAALIAGIPFDGSVVATVDDYNKQIKGDGMRYRVKAWSDR